MSHDLLTFIRGIWQQGLEVVGEDIRVFVVIVFLQTKEQIQPSTTQHVISTCRL